MEETLIIKNFGPIESVELKLKQFTILIGEQATGKSTVAKVLATIYSLLDSNPLRRSELDSFTRFKQNLAVYEIQNYLKPNSFIQLIGKINFELKDGYVSSNLQELAKGNFLKKNNLTYIPADRVATSLFTNSTWADLIDVEDGRVNMPKYFLRFFSLYSRIKENKEFDFTKTLGIKLVNKNGTDKIMLKDGTEISVFESASAIQTNLPLFVIVDWQTHYKDPATIFLIEEPELNFFPSTQYITTQYLVDAALHSFSNMLLTTHSPYILSSVNNLIYAYQVGLEHLEEVNNIIDKKYWVNPKDVSAYRLLSDGTARNILDDELNQIDAGELDGISRSINEIWDKIADIEFSRVNEN